MADAYDNLFREVAPEVQRYLGPSLPSLAELSETEEPKVNPTRVLDMKFRQMQVYSIKNNMPTDEEMEAYRENHRRRMQRIEERFHTQGSKPCTEDAEAFESVEMIKAEEEKEMVPLFTVIKRAPTLQADSVESDLVLEDLSSGEEEVPCSREIVLVRKTQADKAAEKRLVERLANHLGDAKAREEEEIQDFGEVESLLQDGKVPHNSILERQKAETVVEWPQVEDKFRSYLSWQTEGSTPPSQVID